MTKFGSPEYYLRRAEKMEALAEKFGVGFERDRAEALGLAARFRRLAGANAGPRLVHDGTLGRDDD